MIVKFIMKSRERVVRPAYIDDQSDPAIKAQRVDLLRSRRDEPNENARLTYHLNLVSLLAACAEGENKYSKCFWKAEGLTCGTNRAFLIFSFAKTTSPPLPPPFSLLS